MNLTDGLAPYGATLDPAGFIVRRDGKVLDIKLRMVRDRIRAENADGHLVWSGCDIGHFVETYFYWEKS